jgi:hypothetical protein
LISRDKPRFGGVFYVQDVRYAARGQDARSVVVK